MLPIHSLEQLLKATALVSAAISAAILVWYLARRPPLGRATKVNGLKHLYYYVSEYADTGPYGEGGEPIHMYKPFQNGMCTRCHSMTAPGWVANEEHAGMLAELESGDARCVDCHGGAAVHPRSFAHGGSGRAPAGAAGQGGQP